MRSPVIKVLVADAQLLFADAVAVALAKYSGLTTCPQRPRSLRELAEAVAECHPDVVLVDYWLNSTEPLYLIYGINERVPEAKIIFLSAFHGPNQVNEALTYGAAGFLPKGLSLDQMNDAVQRAHAGECPVFADELRAVVERMNERQRFVEAIARRLATLTAREIDILRLLGTGLSVVETASELNIAASTVQRHVHNIYAKTSARSQLEAITMAREHGLID